MGLCGAKAWLFTDRFGLCLLPRSGLGIRLGGGLGSLHFNLVFAYCSVAELGRRGMGVLSRRYAIMDEMLIIPVFSACKIMMVAQPTSLTRSSP